MADRSFKNLAITDPVFRGKMNGACSVALNESGDTGQSVDLDIVHELGADAIVNGDFATGDLTGWDQGIAAPVVVIVQSAAV